MNIRACINLFNDSFMLSALIKYYQTISDEIKTFFYGGMTHNVLIKKKYEKLHVSSILYKKFKQLRILQKYTFVCRFIKRRMKSFTKRGKAKLSRNIPFFENF